MGKYTYIVEIDTQQAQKEVAALRDLFRRGLGDLAIAPSAGAGLGQAMRDQQQMVRAADQAQESLVDAAAAAAKLDAALGRVFADLGINPMTADVGEMSEALERLERQARDTGAEIEAMMLRPATKKDPQWLVKVEEHYRKTEDMWGKEAVAEARAQGLVYSLGEVGAEFVQDRIPPGDWNVRAVNDDVVERQRLSAQEKQRTAELELQQIEEQIALARMQGEIAERQAKEYSAARATLLSAGATEDDVADMTGDMNRLFSAMNSAQAEEERLVAEYARLFEKLEREAAEARAKAEKTQVKEIGGSRITTTKTGDTAGAVTQTFNVGASTAKNLQSAAADFRQMADDSERYAINNERAARAMASEVDDRIRMTKANAEAARDADVARLKQQGENDANLKAAEAQAKVEAEAAKQATREVQKNAKIREQLTQSAVNKNHEAQKRKTEQTREGEKRRTDIVRTENAERLKILDANIKAEADKRKQAMRLQELEVKNQMRLQQQQQRRGGMGVLGNFINPTSIAYGLAASLGIYSIDTAARQAYDQGKLGAQQERIGQTFDFLASRVESSSERIITAMQEASAGTVNEADAMALAAQVLAQRFAQGRDDIAEDLAVFTKAARRFTQVYADESGNFLTTQEVFGRLVKYIREGNKELVDQFGISNQLIADMLNIPNEGLRGAEGAGLRFEGTVRFLREEMERLGESTYTSADRIEASEARITDSFNRIRQAAAPATANVAEFTADMLDNLADNYTLGTAQMNTLGNTQQLSAAKAELADLQRDMTEYFEVWRQGGELTGRTAEKYELTKQRIAQLQGEVQRLTQESIRLYQIESKLDPKTQAMAQSFGALSDISNPLIRNLEDAEKHTITMASSFDEATASLDSNARAVAGAVLEYYELNGAMAALIPNIEKAALAAAGFTTLRSNLELYGARSKMEAEYPGMDGGIPVNYTTSEDKFDQEMELLREKRIAAQNEAKEEYKTQQKAREEWERAAKAAADAWASELESALQSVPGLFGTSDVTKEDMQLAEAGVYQEKADEYLRRLSDEVLNKDAPDYADVDIKDAARRAGIDPNLPAEIILTLFKQAWADQSLFADGANLDLINQDAVQAELDRQERSKSGQDAIRQLFGLPAADETGSAIGIAAGAAFIETATAGNTPQELAAAVTVNQGGDALAQGVDDASMEAAAAALISSLESSFKTTEIQDRLYNLGYSMPAAINNGFKDGAADLEWSDALVGAVADQVLEALAAATEAQAAGAAS